MCGRYYVDDETAREIEKLVREIDKKLAEKSGKKDIHPSETASVLCEKQEELAIRQQYWGFYMPAPAASDRQQNTLPKSQTAKTGNIIFNARIESAYDKPMFSESIRNRRIIVPARGFYEWDKGKTKHTFFGKDGEILCMAGVYKHFGDQERFVILTAPADTLMEPIHDRMPLILEKNQIEDWIFDEKAARKLAKEAKPRLERRTDYEQQSLSFLE